MAYNGIGLASVRGSGTSGYVQTNKFHLRSSRLGPRDSLRDRDELPSGTRKPNQEILEHNRKRAVEIKLLLLRESLEEKGCAPTLNAAHAAVPPPRWRSRRASLPRCRRLSEEEIEEQLTKQRARLAAEAEQEAAKQTCVARHRVSRRSAARAAAARRPSRLSRGARDAYTH
jgi:hypothetical protein